MHSSLLCHVWWEFTDKPEDKTHTVTCVRWEAPAGDDECRRKFYGEFMWLAKLRRTLHRWAHSHA